MVQWSRIHNFELRRDARDRVVQRWRGVALIVIVVISVRGLTHSTGVQGCHEAAVVVAVIIAVLDVNLNLASRRRHQGDRLIFAQLEEIEDEESEDEKIAFDELEAANENFHLEWHSQRLSTKDNHKQFKTYAFL